MKSLFVTSWAGFSGKTAVCLGLAQVFRENNKKTGYFRPIGRPSLSSKGDLVDQDVLVMKEVLNLPFDMSDLVPVILEPNYISVYIKRDVNKIRANIKSKYEDIASNFEYMIVEGSLSPEAMSTFSLDNLSIAKILDSKILMVTGGFQDETIDQIIFYKQIIEKEGLTFLGVILNQIPEHKIDVVKKEYSNLLKERGVKIWGIIPRNYEVTSPTVRDVIDLLHGQVLVKGDETRLVEKILIGAMQTDAALRFLRRTENNAVITGGDRPDIISASIETNASIVILTGNLVPSEQVLTKAEEKNITVIVVPQDSYNTVKALEPLSGKIHPKDKRKIQLTKKMIEEHVDWRGLISEL